jgi:ABC-2 type transport system permease protein
MLTLAIFFSSAFLQQATVEDRQNRMIEILLSSTDTNQLLLGKIIGLAGAGLLQVTIYLALLIVPAMTLTIALQVPLARLALSFVYFLLGYTLFACLMAGTGALGRTAQESAQMSAIWTLTSAAPMGLLAAITSAPNGALARGLSFFPLTAPVTMLVRLSSGDPPVIDIVASIAVCILATYVSLRAAAKILRASFLMHGKRATLPELIHWLRAA